MSDLTDLEQAYRDYRRARADASWSGQLAERYDLEDTPQGLVPREAMEEWRARAAESAEAIAGTPQPRSERAIRDPLREPEPKALTPPGSILAPEKVVPAAARAAPALAKGAVKGATDMPADVLGAVQDVVNWATGSHGEWAEKFRLFEKSTDPVEQMSRGAIAFLMSFASIAGAIGKVGTGIKLAKDFPALLKTARNLGGAFGASFATKEGGIFFHAAEWAKGQMPEAVSQQLDASVAMLPLPVREAMDWLATQNPDDPEIEQRFKKALTNVVDTALIGTLFQVGKFLAKAPQFMEGGAPTGGLAKAGVVLEAGGAP